MRYLLFIILLSSCAGNKNAPEAAKATCERFFAFMKTKQVDSAKTLFDSDIFKRKDTPQLFQTMNALEIKYGPLIAHKLRITTTSTGFEGGKTEHTAGFTYELVYASGHVAKESFTFQTGYFSSGKIDSVKIENQESN